MGQNITVHIPPVSNTNIKTPTIISNKLNKSLDGIKNVSPFIIAKVLPDKT